MAKSATPARSSTKQTSRQVLEVRLGQAGVLVGTLVFVQQGAREVAQFAYAPSWLASPAAFAISPDLPLAPGYASRRSPSREDSVFFGALADTEPDSWGRRVIDRAHARARKADPGLGPLTTLDYLCAVDDLSRVGALRIVRNGAYQRSAAPGQRTTPPLIELEQMARAVHAVETSTETQEDLRYLQGKGTSLGGMRPKCSVIDGNGRLAIGKFPSVGDTVDVTRGEVLALHLAERAGIDAAKARVTELNGTPVALIERFDRTPEGTRTPYLSAASLLQARRDETRSYAELVDELMRSGSQPQDDARALWRRLVFNLLITNTDDHLHNTGLLYAGARQWRLSPAFDLNPMPGKLRESKTWLTPGSGPIDSVPALLENAAYFHLGPGQALEVLRDVVDAVQAWRAVAAHPSIGLTPAAMNAFVDAFEHEQLQAAQRALGRLP
ncbi:MAG: type II toxin-antitoxin system HipA family toxin [Rubrivivax sp.]|nr:type II toxin-antitoxin system HipA family toxin [Rubrivivax sp.]